MSKIVFIEKIPKEGPRGDRDRVMHPYFDYRVHLINSEGEALTADTAIHSVSGYETWHSTIRPEGYVLDEVTKHAEKLAKNLGARIIWDGENLSVFKVTCSVMLLAADEADAMVQFQARYAAGKIHFGIAEQSRARR